MKKIALLAVAAMLGAVQGAFAVNFFDEFKDRLESQYLRPFARDIGGLIGSADFHSGRALGMPGFDVGVTGSFQAEPSKDNGVLRAAGVKVFGLPMAYASVGLPLNLDVVVRGTGMQGAMLLGGGVRYGLVKTTVAKFIPDVTVSMFYDVLSHDYLKLKHFSADISASFDLPVVKPFAGVGLDKTNLETKVDSGSAVPVPSGTSVNTSEPRMTLGANVALFPLVYLTGAYNWLHGNSGFQLGLGAKF